MDGLNPLDTDPSCLVVAVVPEKDVKETQPPSAEALAPRSGTLELAVAEQQRSPRSKGRPLLRVLGAARLWFNTYRKLFAVISAANLILMVLAATGYFNFGTTLGHTVPSAPLNLSEVTCVCKYPSQLRVHSCAGKPHAVGWTVGNVLISVLFRNELFLWAVCYFPLVMGCKALHAPTWFKHRCAASISTCTLSWPDPSRPLDAAETW